MTYAHYLEERKPMTNADRIRSMNNKALAEVLLDHKCSSCDFDGFCKQKTICRKGILEWLRDEVSE